VRCGGRLQRADICVQIHQPGGELFVVYNEDRNTSSLGVPGLSTRSIIVKVNRLFRY
jgi:hypothetical protein